MKQIVFIMIFVLLPIFVFAESWDNKRPYKDSWGNSYKHQQNLWKDSDRDGVINYYDYNDKNPRVQNPYQYDNRNYDTPRNNYRQNQRRY